MKSFLIATATAVSLICSAPMANAKGCLKGAAVGGVAGHVAGKHGLAGAAIGCAVGHHHDKVKAQKQAEAQKQAATENR
jgi:hypothetical protein